MASVCKVPEEVRWSAQSDRKRWWAGDFKSSERLWSWLLGSWERERLTVDWKVGVEGSRRLETRN